MSAFDRAAITVTRNALTRAQDGLDLLAPREPKYKGYSLRQGLLNLTTDERRGLAFEISQDLERTRPATHGGIIVPWEVLTRADVVATTGAGGYLVETTNIEAADALRPNTVVAALGATIIPAVGNINLPRLTGVASASWLPTESTQQAESDQSFGQVSYTPHTVSGYTEYSRLLMLQSAPAGVEAVVRRDLIAILGRALDYTSLFGSGAAGQPHGLAGLAGVGTFSGTTLALSGLVDAAVSLGDGLNDSAGVAANRTVAGALKKRQESAGSTRLLWEGSLVNGSCIGFPARSSTALTAGSLFLGSWQYLNIVVWGEGIEVAVNPFDPGNFTKGIVGVRAMLTCDVAPSYPSAFTYAAAVT
jgi:HK97 family phage major capsid protein